MKKSCKLYDFNTCKPAEDAKICTKQKKYLFLHEFYGIKDEKAFGRKPFFVEK